MIKVFCIYRTSVDSQLYESRTLLGIFSSREKAQAELDNAPDYIQKYISEYSIEEHLLDYLGRWL